MKVSYSLIGIVTLSILACVPTFAGTVKGTSNAGSGVIGKSKSGTGVYGSSTNGIGVYGSSNMDYGVRALTGNASSYSLYVDYAGGDTGTTSAAIYGGLYLSGTLFVSGSKSGYVVDIMQNGSGEALETGDLVEIVGCSAPVLGEIPVVVVRKASTAYSTALAGVVDAPMYAPTPALVSAHQTQEQNRKSALAEQASRRARGDVAGADAMTIPEVTIGDKEVEVHPMANTAAATPGTYLSAVTLGAYKAIKVDASYGAIEAGDLLVSSANPGYAMKAGKNVGSGATVGKALSGLASGTGTIPVLVTLR